MNLRAELTAARVLAIVRRPDVDEVVTDLADQLLAAGVRAMEVTLDQPASVTALRRLVAHAGDRILVGAGTVMAPAQLDEVIEAGGRFAVCPHLDADLVSHAQARGLAILPGVTSSSEVAAAVALGLDAVKLFPAGPLGVPYLRALRGPFRDVGFVPTGGIAVADAAAWLEAGAIAVGLGSALIGPDGVDASVTALVRGSA